jgi:hypothetical protein
MVAISLPFNQPLSPNPYTAQAHPGWNSAYDQCLQLQISNPQLAMHARCLGFLIIEAIDDASRDYITEEILQCMADDNKLQDYTSSTYSACVSRRP